MHQHPGTGNYQYNHVIDKNQYNQDLFTFNESFKYKHNTSLHNKLDTDKDIVPNRFPNKNIKFTSDIKISTLGTLNPSAILFYP